MNYAITVRLVAKAAAILTIVCIMYVTYYAWYLMNEPVSILVWWKMVVASFVICFVAPASFQAPFRSKNSKMVNEVIIFVFLCFVVRFCITAPFYSKSYKPLATEVYTVTIALACMFVLNAFLFLKRSK